MIDQSQRRLCWALGASALLHAWLVQSGEGSYARRAADRGDARIAATLITPPLASINRDTLDATYDRSSTRDASAAPAASQTNRFTETPAASRVAPQPGAAVPRSAHNDRGAASPALTDATLPRAAAAPQPQPQPQREHSTSAAASTALPGDPTYYTARSLDVYPRALTSLDLGALPGAGTVRALVLIDEAGNVNDVRAIDAATTEIKQWVRDMLLRTQFSPASRDGRLVKAQLQLRLAYGASAPQ